MLKYTPAAIIVMLLAAVSCKPDGEAYRTDFVKGCVNRFAKDSSVASTQGRILVEEYCICMGDQLNAKMNADQWRTFNKSGDSTLSQFKEILQPCTDSFQKKLSALKPESAGN